MRTLWLVALPLLLAACKKEAPPEPIATAPITAPAPLPPAVVAPAKVAVAPAVVDERFERVYFDFDSADLDGHDLSVLTDAADILKRHPMLVIEVQGHCDERGTIEYNLALGERRAEMAARYIAALGVERSRIETISYGEEYPLAAGHDELTWSQNRRVEFRVVARMPGDERVYGTVEQPTQLSMR